MFYEMGVTIHFLYLKIVLGFEVVVVEEYNR